MQGDDDPAVSTLAQRLATVAINICATVGVVAANKMLFLGSMPISGASPSPCTSRGCPLPPSLQLVLRCLPCLTILRLTIACVTWRLGCRSPPTAITLTWLHYCSGALFSRVAIGAGAFEYRHVPWREVFSVYALNMMAIVCQVGFRLCCSSDV